jgi:hypothetical protein
MSYTIGDFDKIPTDKMLDKLSIDDFFKKFSKEDILTYLKNAEKSINSKLFSSLNFSNHVRKSTRRTSPNQTTP